MLALVVATAAALGVTLVVGLVAALVYVTHIRAFLAETAEALEVVGRRATLVASRLDRVRVAFSAAAEHVAGRDG